METQFAKIKISKILKLKAPLSCSPKWLLKAKSVRLKDIIILICKRRIELLQMRNKTRTSCLFLAKAVRMKTDKRKKVINATRRYNQPKSQLSTPSLILQIKSKAKSQGK